MQKRQNNGSDTNLSFEERRVSAESPCQYVVIDLVTKITAEDPEIICNKQGKQEFDEDTEEKAPGAEKASHRI